MNHGIGGNGGDDRRGREFQLVNPRKITITIFTGKQLNTNPYMPFNNAIRNLILTQGHDGEELLEVLDHIESFGGESLQINTWIICIHNDQRYMNMLGQLKRP